MLHSSECLTRLFYISSNKLLPSGDSSCTYVPVKYRCTRADFPLDRFPTMPCNSKEQNTDYYIVTINQKSVDTVKEHDGDLNKNSQHKVSLKLSAISSTE